jgi:phosphoribosylaminoimidazole-succinocarboxamide synthase
LIEHNFQGKAGQSVPDLPEEFIDHVTNRYIELYEKITNEKFYPESYDHRIEDIQRAVNSFVESL